MQALAQTHGPAQPTTGFSMGKINVGFDGKRLFEWEGDGHGIATIENTFWQLAINRNVDPKAFAQSIVRGIARHQRFFEGDRRVQMMAVIYFLLQLPTQNPDRPGPYRNYMPVWNFNFTFDIHEDEATSEASVNAKGNFGDPPIAPLLKSGLPPRSGPCRGLLGE